MRYQPINSQLFIGNRKRFAEALASNSVAVFNSNDVMPTNADGTMRFKQNNDLYYLSGIDQEETVLLIAPNARDAQYREVLFVKETNDLIAKWEGEKLSKEQARAQSGISTVLWLSEFKRVLGMLATDSTHIYLNTNEHARSSSVVETRDARFLKWCKEKYPLHQYRRSAPLMQTLREVKSELEIEAMKKAVAITAKGFQRILKFVKPGVGEHELEAELAHEFIKERADGFAYSPIIAGGRNACILHYVKNNATLMAGDLVLLDVAAEYAQYDSDLTRTIPVSGRFSPRQKAIYEAVLRVQKEAISLMRPGLMLGEYEREVARMMESELIGLKLISRDDVAKQDPKNPAYKRYYYHNSSHFLGLDTHDLGAFTQPLRAGMVLTVEPGIYVMEEGIGIRIEDNILITENGPVNLMTSIPKEVEEIEAAMSR